MCVCVSLYVKKDNKLYCYDHCKLIYLFVITLNKINRLSF